MPEKKPKGPRPRKRRARGGVRDDGSADAPERTPEQIEAEIEETREELGETVAELAEKTDVKKQAKEKVDETKQAASDKAEQARDRTSPASARTQLRSRRAPRRRWCSSWCCGAGADRRTEMRMGETVGGDRARREHGAAAVGKAADREESAERDQVRDDVDPVRADYAPQGTDARTGLWPTLKRTALEFQEDNMTDWAAALTYYGLLSLFPALIALVSVLGLFGDPQTTTQQITDIVTQIGPSSAADTFSGPIESITSNRSAAGILFFVGLATALWSASGYIGAFMRASNIAWETPEGRPSSSCGHSSCW